MNRITLVFPSKAEAERAYQDLRARGASQGAVTLLGHNDPRLDSGLSAGAGRDPGDSGVPVIAPIGAVAGTSATFGNGIVSGAAPAYVAPALLDTVRGGDVDYPSTGDRTQSAMLPGDAQGQRGDGSREGSTAHFSSAGYPPQEAEYYQSALSQGRAVMQVELLQGEDEAQVRQILGQYDGHPYLPSSSGR